MISTDLRGVLDKLEQIAASLDRTIMSNAAEEPRTVRLIAARAALLIGVDAIRPALKAERPLFFVG